MRAYRIIEILQDDEASFNLSRNPDVMNLFDMSYDDEILSLDQQQIERALESKELEPDTIEILQVMLRHAKENGGQVQYYCY